MDVRLGGLDGVEAGDHAQPTGHVAGLVDKLEHGVGPVTAGVRQVKAGTSGAEAAGLVPGGAVHLCHVTILYCFMETKLNPESASPNPAFPPPLFLPKP